MTGSLFRLFFALLVAASSLFYLAESKKRKEADVERCEEREAACGPAERGSIMAAAAALSEKARRNPSAALDFVQKEYMAIDDAEKKKCVSVVEEASREYLLFMKSSDRAMKYFILLHSLS